MKREKVDEFWRVSWDDVAGGGEFNAEVREEAHAEAAAMRESYDYADVRVVHITRYRLAPLRPVKAKWRCNRREVSWSVITGPCSAFVEQRERGFAWWLCGTTERGTIFDLYGEESSVSGYAAFVAVSEVAKVMGFRLPKMPEGV